MLKIAGFSLLEMLISIAVSSLIIMGCSTFYVQLQASIMQYAQRIRLEQNVQYVLAGLAKDIRRAGFIANNPTKMKAKPIEIHQQYNCIIIRYDSEIRHDWIYNPFKIKNSDVFSYRFNKNSLEYKTGSIDCQGSNWEKLLDPSEFNVTHFIIRQRSNAIELSLNVELKNNQHINYQVTKIIKNENLF